MMQQWSNSGTAVEQQWNSSVATVEQQCSNSGTAVEQQWNSSGATVELQWNSSGATVEQQWSSSGATVEQEQVVHILYLLYCIVKFSITFRKYYLLIGTIYSNAIIEVLQELHFCHLLPLIYYQVLIVLLQEQ